ncbi:hypothetical protein BC829DRAFT_279518 [Chytridium lagenaria]|nr:hypothetical protein BC829DRAFT_279518 [Chytridium lagenaria]
MAYPPVTQPMAWPVSRSRRRQQEDDDSVDHVELDHFRSALTRRRAAWRAAWRSAWETLDGPIASGSGNDSGPSAVDSTVSAFLSSRNPPSSRVAEEESRGDPVFTISFQREFDNRGARTERTAETEAGPSHLASLFLGEMWLTVLALRLVFDKRYGAEWGREAFQATNTAIPSGRREAFQASSNATTSSGSREASQASRNVTTSTSGRETSQASINAPIFSESRETLPASTAVRNSPAPRGPMSSSQITNSSSTTSMPRPLTATTTTTINVTSQYLNLYPLAHGRLFLKPPLKQLQNSPCPSSVPSCPIRRLSLPSPPSISPSLRPRRNMGFSPGFGPIRGRNSASPSLSPRMPPLSSRKVIWLNLFNYPHLLPSCYARRASSPVASDGITLKLFSFEVCFLFLFTP